MALETLEVTFSSPSCPVTLPPTLPMLAVLLAIITKYSESLSSFAVSLMGSATFLWVSSLRKLIRGSERPRFWFGLSVLPLTVTFILIFLFSGLQLTWSLVVLSILYFLFTVVFYTMNNVSFNAELPLISEDPYDQSNMCTINSVFTSAGSLAVAITVPLLRLFGGGKGGEYKASSWIILASFLAVIAIVGQVLSFVKVKEKKEISIESKESLTEDELEKGLKSLLKSKYFYLAISMFFINYYLSLSVSNVGIYYADVVLGDSIYSTYFASFPMISMGIGLLLTPLLVKKIGKNKTLSIAIGAVFAGNLIGGLFPYDFAVGISGALIKGLGSAIVMSQLFTLAPDIVRYISLKDDVRVEGLAASGNSFGSKIGSGIGAAAVLWALSLSGYNGEEGAVQAPAVGDYLISLYWWIPAALALVLFVISLFWDINKKSDKMEKDKAVVVETAPIKAD